MATDMKLPRSHLRLRQVLRYIALASLFATLALIAAAKLCAVDDRTAFRYPISQRALDVCAQLVPLQLSKGETEFSEAKIHNASSNHENLIGSEEDSPLRCPIQAFKNGSVNYDIAFMEFNDAGSLREPKQKDRLVQYLQSKEKLNVIVFVHGWRNDADVGSNDVRRFHKLVALSANYANQRASSVETQVPTLGIFVGWRGRAVAEPDNEAMATAWAALTFWGRKNKSDELAKPIGDEILRLEKLVKGDAKGSGRNLTIVGHSLGGNIVLRGLSKEISSRIEKTQSPSLIQGVGDMVVLINPAAEATEIKPLQLSVRRFLGISDNAAVTNSVLAPIESECVRENIDSTQQSFTTSECLRRGTSKRLSDKQTPIFISLTAAKYYRQMTCESKDKWDHAVGLYLPLMLKVKHMCSPTRENLTSVGNYLPVRGGETREIFGVSHEMEIDAAKEARTTYKFAGHGAMAGAARPICLPEENGKKWLDRAIDSKKGAMRGRGWDVQVSTEIPVDPQSKGVRVNIRHGTTRNECSANFQKTDKSPDKCAQIVEDSGFDMQSSVGYRIPLVGEGRDPVWNVATHPNTIEEHDGYLSHAVWCVLNRFVLDKTQ